MLIKRNIFPSLKSHLNKPEITLIIGPRQAGKTTLMRQLENHLHRQHQKTIWFNLDIESDARYFTSQQLLLQQIRYTLGSQKGYVFIDEIQRKTNAGLFLKGLYDMNLGYKFIVSGSGSLELKEQISESLVGRKRLFYLSTLTFTEFVHYRENYYGSLQDLYQLNPQKLHLYWEEYLRFGGYPKVVLAETISEKQQELQEIYQSYLEKDLLGLLKIEKSDQLTQLVQLLANQVGQLVNFSKLANSLNLSLPTVKKYLWYLEKTFILAKLTPYFNNPRKEIVKAPIYYFLDLGLANFISGNHALPTDFQVQNYVYLQLKEKLQNQPASLHFWRTQDGAEIDFVISQANSAIPLEVKNKSLKSPALTRSFHSFLHRYHPPRAYLVSQTHLPNTKLNHTTLYFPSFPQLPFLKL